MPSVLSNAGDTKRHAKQEEMGKGQNPHIDQNLNSTLIIDNDMVENIFGSDNNALKGTQSTRPTMGILWL